MDLLREREVRVPEDVAVVGFDDLPSLAESMDPALTTVHQDIVGMGRTMARLLFRESSDVADGSHPLTSVITPTRLVVRESA